MRSAQRLRGFLLSKGGSLLAQAYVTETEDIWTFVLFSFSIDLNCSFLLIRILCTCS